MSNKPIRRDIPLNQLVKSPQNVRTTPPPKADDNALAASIEANGLLQNLLVVPSKDPNVFEVFAGGRRLDALNALAEQGKLAKDEPVDCKVGAWKSVKEASLAENVQRVEMDAIDQYKAYVDLVDEGRSPVEIAKRFGKTERHIQQRLRLGRLSPALHDAYQHGKLDLETLQAFTLTDDHERQLTVWKQVKGQVFARAGSVRRLLTEKSVSSTSALGRFVGAAAYEKAGGALRTDLFSDRNEGFFDDVGLLQKVALGKLEKRAKTLAKSWKWAEARLDANYGDAAQFGRVHPQPIGVPAEVEEELAANHKRQDELMQLDEEDWTEALEEESDKLLEREEELKAIVVKHTDFSDEQKTRAGCIVTIDQSGRYQIFEGLLRQEDIAEEVNDNESGVSTDVSVPASAETKARNEAGVGKSHAEDLTAHRQQIARAKLAGDFTVAFDLVLYCLCVDRLSFGFHQRPLDVTTGDAARTSSLDDLGRTPAAVELDEAYKMLDLSWTEGPKQGWFDALSALPQAEKEKLLAWCAAEAFEGQLSFEPKANPAIERAIDRLDIDFAAHFRPTADNYWGRVKKSDALAIAGDVLGAQWRGNHASDKKPVLAKALERAFSGDEAQTATMDADARARAAAWTPPGFIPNTSVSGDVGVPSSDIELRSEDDDAGLPAFLQDDADDSAAEAA